MGKIIGCRRSFCRRRRDIRYSTDFSGEKERHGGREKLRFEGTASTDTVWAHGDFGSIPSPYSELEIYVELCGKVLAFIRVFDYN